MTIQNIDDVMDRIMSLNRNLTEDSLKVLLSASGWDREDISEGLRIFRNKSKNGVIATPIPNKVFELDPNKIEENIQVPNKNINLDNSLNNKVPDPKTNLQANKDNYDILYQNKQSLGNNPYTFNLQNNQNNNQEVQHEDIVSPAVQSNKTEFKGNVNPYILRTDSKNTLNNQSVSTPVLNKDTEPKNNSNISTNKSHRLAKVIFYILLLIILGFLFLYFFHPKFKNIINQNFNSNNVSNIESLNPKQDLSKIESNQNNQPIQTVGINVNSTQNDINQLKNDLASLRGEFNSFKNSDQGQSKTIVKYISQRGPAGRGILTASATSTGFIITYTDGSKQIIPFSTSTQMNSLNVEEICFRNTATSTETTYLSGTNTSSSLNSFDICLNKSQVLNILQN